MSDEAALWFLVVLLTIFFAGDPDLHDALMHYLMGEEKCTGLKQ